MSCMKYIWGQEKWSTFNWYQVSLSQLLEEVSYLQGKLVGKFEALSDTDNKELWLENLIDEARSTSKIEGIEIDVNSFRSSLLSKLGFIKNAKSHKKTDDGLAEILIDCTKSFNEKLSLKKIHGWHSSLFPTGVSGFQRIRVGKFRKEGIKVISGEIRERIHFEGPPAEGLKQEMKTMILWVNQEQATIPNNIKSGIAHLYFVTLHPYDDGNGRLARCLTDFLLAKNEKKAFRTYSFSKAIYKKRNEYYDILEKTQKGSLNITEWLTWFLETLIFSIEDALQTMSVVQNRALFWSKAHQVGLTQRQEKALKKMMDVYPEEFKGGMTSKKYASINGCLSEAASREIRDLITKGLMVKDPEGGGGRATRYLVNVEND